VATVPTDKEGPRAGQQEVAKVEILPASLLSGIVGVLLLPSAVAEDRTQRSMR
jgi:hypothetical protein